MAVSLKGKTQVKMNSRRTEDTRQYLGHDCQAFGDILFHIIHLMCEQTNELNYTHAVTIILDTYCGVGK